MKLFIYLLLLWENSNRSEICILNKHKLLISLSLSLLCRKNMIRICYKQSNKYDVYIFFSRKKTKQKKNYLF